MTPKKKKEHERKLYSALFVGTLCGMNKMPQQSKQWFDHAFRLHKMSPVVKA